MLVALLGATTLAACEKNAVQDISGPIPSARVRFFNFGLNAPSVNFYAGAVKMTATTSATGVEATTGVSYGNVGSGGFYAAIAPNTYDLQGKIAATVDKDLTVASINALILDGRSYSYYMSGVYDATAKKSDAFIIEDGFPPTIDFGTSLVRFVNASHNSVPMQLFARNTTTLVEVPVGDPVPYKSGGAYAPLPGAVYDLVTRSAGGTVALISRTGVSFLPGRVYSISARGDMTIVSTTLANRPILDFTSNR
jgi:hypothetical protein